MKNEKPKPEPNPINKLKLEDIVDEWITQNYQECFIFMNQMNIIKQNLQLHEKL